MAPDARRPGFVEEACTRLEGARLGRAGRPCLSLDPRSRSASTLAAIARSLAGELEVLGPEGAKTFADGMIGLADAIATHFPDNLLFDLDALAAGLLDEALAAAAPARHLGGAFEEVIELHARFGQKTPLRFRYIHDFAYGFDWAKWVRRGPESRAGVRPFDRQYLRAMLERGDELLSLIEQNDPTYPRLVTTAARNPFRFSREPEDELKLYRELRASDLIPVRAWELRPTVEWDRPYAEERERRADALRLTKARTTAPPTT